MIEKSGAARGREVVEDVATLFSEGVRDGHDALRETASAVALRTEAFLAPEDEATELAFSVIVGGLDAGVVDEGPKSAP